MALQAQVCQGPRLFSMKVKDDKKSQVVLSVELFGDGREKNIGLREAINKEQSSIQNGTLLTYDVGQSHNVVLGQGERFDF